MQNQTITIASAQETPSQIKILDEHGKTWSFFKTKKAGGPTVAYEQWGNYEIGDTVGVGYDEKPLANGGTVRAILTFQPPRYGQQAAMPSKASPRGNSGATSASQTLRRNFDREAYEKCCSIWAGSAVCGDELLVKKFTEMLEEGVYWQLFQAIRADGAKRFSTGWQRAEAVFGKEEKQEPLEFEPEPDIEAGNKAIQDFQAAQRDVTPLESLGAQKQGRI